MSRRSRRLLAFALVGVVANLAVAWSFATRSTPETGAANELRITEHATDWEWLDRVDSGLSRSDTSVDCFTEVSAGSRNRVMQMGGAVVGLKSRAGWPWGAVEGGYWVDPATSERRLYRALPAFLWPARTGYDRVLGLSPLPVGFIANSVLYAVTAALLWFACLTVRRWYRRGRGRCPWCGYPAGASSRCSECGQPVRSSVRPS